VQKSFFLLSLGIKVKNRLLQVMSLFGYIERASKFTEVAADEVIVNNATLQSSNEDLSALNVDKLNTDSGFVTWSGDFTINNAYYAAPAPNWFRLTGPTVQGNLVAVNNSQQLVMKGSSVINPRYYKVTITFDVDNQTTGSDAYSGSFLLKAYSNRFGTLMKTRPILCPVGKLSTHVVVCYGSFNVANADDGIFIDAEAIIGATTHNVRIYNVQIAMEPIAD
jgi:hypothetical protein